MSVPRRAAPLLLLWLAGLAPAPAGAADDEGEDDSLILTEWQRRWRRRCERPSTR